MSAVSVIGLGKLGLPFAACLAESGLDVVGVDVDASVVAGVEAGRVSSPEPGVTPLVAAVGGKRLHATTDVQEAVARTELTFLFLPSPSGPDGALDGSIVERTLETLGAAVHATGKRQHVFTVATTLQPGQSDARLRPRLEAASGLRVGDGLGLCYAPENVALGAVLEGYQRPEWILVGQSDAASGARVAGVLRRVCGNDPPVLRTTLVEAEIAKLGLNAILTAKMSFANLIAQVCAALPGADPDVVTELIGLDGRVGTRFLRAGPSFGGPCFPRDVRAFAALCRAAGASPSIMEAVEEINRTQDARLLSAALDAAGSTGAREVVLLGASFKPGVASLEASPAVPLARGLLAAGLGVVVHDPLAGQSLADLLGAGARVALDAAACLAEARAAVLLHGDEGAVRAVLTRLAGNPPLAVVDCWRRLPATGLPHGVTVMRFPMKIARVAPPARLAPGASDP